LHVAIEQYFEQAFCFQTACFVGDGAGVVDLVAEIAAAVAAYAVMDVLVYENHVVVAVAAAAVVVVACFSGVVDF